MIQHSDSFGANVRCISMFALLFGVACSSSNSGLTESSGGVPSVGGGAAGAISGGAGASSVGGASGGGAPVGTAGAAAAGTGGNVEAGDGGASGGGAPIGCGMGGATTAPPTTGVCSGAGTRVLTLADAKVEDFEASVISPGWSSFSDPDNGGAHDVFQMALVTTDGAATTKQSGEYKGSGILTVKEGGFGAGTVFNVAIDKAQNIYCVDVSAFDGVAFWAKAKVSGAQVNVSFVVPETNAQGAPGGDCTESCYQHPFKAITLTDQWAPYTVKFADAGGGTAKVNGRVQELLWTTPDKDFDFSLDEIAFFKCTPPSGPVGE